MSTTTVRKQQAKKQDTIIERVRQLAQEVLGKEYHLELHPSSIRQVQDEETLEKIRPYLRQVLEATKTIISTVPNHGKVLLLYIYRNGYGIYIPTNMPNSQGVLVLFNRYGMPVTMRYVNQRNIT